VGDAVVDAQQSRSGNARERIVAGVLQLLERRDVELLTIDVIARTARLSRGTFYRNFADKREAVAAAVGSVYSELLAVPLPLDEPIASAAVERERLANWIRSLVRIILIRPGVHRAIGRSPELSKLRMQRIQVNNDAVRTSLVNYIERLRTAGLVETSAPETLAEGIMCVANGVYKQLIYDRQERASETVLDNGIEMICRGVFRA
jgi:AcrR family transcriptional regulator